MLAQCSHVSSETNPARISSGKARQATQNPNKPSKDAAPKLFGWFGGHGLDGTAAMFDKLGFRPGRTNAIAAGLGEAGGGSLLALGLGTSEAGAAVAGTMIVAASMHRDNGFFVTNGGYEYPAVLGLSAAALTLTGPGAFSLDHLTRNRLNRPWMRGTALAVVVPAATRVIRARQRALAAAQTPAPAASVTESDSAEPAGAAARSTA